MFRKSLFFVVSQSLAGLATVLGLASCASLPPSPKLEAVTPGTSLAQEGRLVIHGLSHEPFVIAENRTAAQAYKLLSFQLSQIPNAAKLEVIMTVKTYACGLKPGLPQGETHFLINQHPVTFFSFDYDDNGKTYRTVIDLDPKLLRVGQNKLEVVGQRCLYGFFEVVRFNGIALAM
ncbi:MAG: hypothetical protein ACE5I9_09550 [Candidatus Methylomirabilales bacterium]